MTTVQRPVETGMTFLGAEEYFAYLGLTDGYHALIQDPYEYASGFPLPKLEMTKKCQHCYLLGFFLGQEIRSSYEEEKIEASGRTTLGDGELTGRDDESRPSVGRHPESDSLAPDGAQS